MAFYYWCIYRWHCEWHCYCIKRVPEDDDDPLHPWCFCQQPSGGNFMIMCDQQGDNCHKWYHGMCVGISSEEGRLMEGNNELYICPSCSQIPVLPQFSPSHPPDFLWNSCLDGNVFCDRIRGAINYLKSRTPLMKSFLKYQNRYNFEIWNIYSCAA